MTIQLFDVGSGQEFASLPWPYSKVLAIGFSPAGSLLAAGCDDSRACLWDVTTNDLVRELKGHKGGVRALAFSTDGSILATGDDAGTIRLWDANAGDEVLRLEKHQHRINSLAFSPDGSRLASASQEPTLRVWDVEEATTVAQLSGHTGSVEAVAFAPQGDTLATAGWDRNICLWNATTYERLHRITGNAGGVKAVVYAPDGQTVISGSDRSISVWQVATARKVRQLAGHRGVVLSLALARNGQTLASGSDDRTLRLWDVTTGQESRTLQENRGSVAAVAFAPDGQMLACVTTGFYSRILRTFATTKPSAQATGAVMSAQERERLWEELAAEDAQYAMAAVRVLASAPGPTVELLQSKLQPAQPIPPHHLAPFRKGALSHNPQDRALARAEFLRLGSLAEPTLREMLGHTLTPDHRQWLEELLDELQGAPQSPETLRELRAVGILERINTPAARQLLEALSRGTTASLLTQEARAALKRATGNSP